jgi:hypothetical protein
MCGAMSRRRIKPASEAPVRLCVTFSGNGFHSKEWWAKGEGKAMELGKVLAPLAEFRERMLFVRGLYHEERAKGTSTPRRRETCSPVRPSRVVERFARARASIRCSPKPTDAARRCRASCWRARSRIPRCTRTTRCSTARTFRGVRRPRRRRWSFTRARL